MDDEEELDEEDEDDLPLLPSFHLGGVRLLLRRGLGLRLGEALRFIFDSLPLGRTSLSLPLLGTETSGAITALPDLLRSVGEGLGFTLARSGESERPLFSTRFDTGEREGERDEE